MGLTRIRAQQISDIDYKQAVRVITLSDITLAGGAPSTVDGVSLTAGDRVLVNGQSNAAQNGLYVVQTLGTGSNGTWARTSDANENGEIQPGMIVMVTEGTDYADTPWKLVTNGTITIGVTELTFTENYSLAFGNIVANGTAVVANTVSGTVSFAAGANVSIVGNSTTRIITFDAIGGGGGTPGGANTQIQFNNDGAFGGSADLTWDGSQVAVTGAITATGNITGSNIATAGNITGSNIATAGELKSTGTFVIGTQQFFAQGSDGFSVNENFNAGNSTVTAYHYTSGAGRNGIVFDTAVTGQFTNGFGATGNAAQNKFVSFAEFSNTTWEWRRGVGISAPNLNGGTLLANINPDGNLYTLGTITATGNITGANVNGGNLSLTGNLSGTAATFTGLSATAANLSVLFTDSHASSSAVRQFRIKSGPRELGLAANLGASNFNGLTSANDLAIVITGPNQGNANLAIIPWASDTSGIRISSVSNVATITVAATTINNTGTVFVTGNVQAANVVSNADITGTTVTATGNITGGNIATAGAVTATGNVQTAANVVYANAAGSPQAYQFYNSAADSIDTVFI